MNKKILFGLSLVASGTIFSACEQEENKENPTSEKNKTPAEVSIEKEANEAPVAYKDGTYSAIGSYNTPVQEATIPIEITLKDGVITKAVAIANQKSPSQVAFSEGIAEKIEGIRIDEIPEFDSVNGASLTVGGFYKAVEKIKEQAK